jgi:N-acetyl-gamma-glutamyl-phosphate reductase
MIKAGITGGAGYTGGELIRLLLRHPGVNISCVQSRSNSGRKIADIHTDVTGDTDLEFSETLHKDIDVLFLCVGHGEAKKFLAANTIAPHTKIIDLSQDFRLADHHGTDKACLVSTVETIDQPFLYGLPELNRSAIATAQNIANPGCFATAIQLGLLPLAQAGLLETVHTTGITGSTGAGQGLQATSHFSWRSGNIQAYKTLAHQHLGEIHQSLNSLQPGKPAKVHFVPWRGDFTRGIYITSYTSTSLSVEEAKELYQKYYAGHPFTILADTMVDLKQVVNTNKCLLYIEKVEDQLIIHSVIDNLLKGASGQAIQNMNLLFGLEETTGLHLKASAF